MNDDVTGMDTIADETGIEVSDNPYGFDPMRAKMTALLDKHRFPPTRRGEVSYYTEQALVKSSSCTTRLSTEATQTWLEKVFADLCLPDDGPLERLLAYHVALSWLALNTAILGREKKWDGGGLCLEAGDFWDRHVSRLRHDFESACGKLGQVRKLRGVNVQFNIAEQQIVNTTA